MRNVVVVGGAGFIGSHLCETLIKRDPRCRVYAVDNLSTGDVRNIEQLYNDKRFEFVNLDASKYNVHRDVESKVDGRIDEIYYLASIASPRLYLRQPFETIRANIDGLLNFLNMANKRRCKILYTSTSEVYGDPERMPQSEDYNGNVDPTCERAVYDETKRVGETLAMTFRRRHGVNTRIVRIFNTYGPRMSRFDGRVVPTFVDQALRGENITVFGDGTQTRSFCYVDDTVDALIRVMKSDYYMPLNVGNPAEYFTVLDVAGKIKNLTKSKSDIDFHPYLSENDPKVRRPDISRIQKVTGWKPKTPMNEGLTRTIAHAKEAL